MDVLSITLKYKANQKEYNIDVDVFQNSFEDDNIEITYNLPCDEASGHIVVFVKTKKEIILDQLYLVFNYSLDKGNMLVNGYQSWTESIESSKIYALKKLRHLVHPFLMRYYGDYHFYKYMNKCMHSCTYTYFRSEDKIDFFGSVNQDNCYTFFTSNFFNNSFTLLADCEGWIVKQHEKVKVVDAYFSINQKEDTVWNTYLSKIKTRRDKIKQCTGWTSWYNYYTHITQEDIFHNLNEISKNNLPLDVFQIDDGYQRAVGDWLISNSKFSKGMKYIADEIKKKGFKPGIWLAPFICDKKSRIYKSHKNWLLKDKNDNLIPAGFNPGWNGKFFILDIYNIEVREYLREVFSTIIDVWGYEMVKLDFLYAVNIYPRNGKTRAQIMKDAMDLINDLCKDKWILGCGVPLSSAFGKVDYCRVGCDVAPYWENSFLEWLGYRERVSTVCSLRSTLHRYRLNGNTFYNDPDVFILRSEDNKLNFNQKYTLFFINNLLGSLIFFSDDVSKYDEDTMFTLKSMFPNLLPKINLISENNNFYTIHFSIDKKNYITYCSLTARITKVLLPEGEFFNNMDLFVEGNKEIIIKPFETKCYLEIDKTNTVNILGSTGYVFPTAEIDKFKLVDDNLCIVFKKDFINKDTIYIEDKLNSIKTINNNKFETITLKNKKIIKYVV